jgi:C-terminal processing protease CtpA/Prc
MLLTSYKIFLKSNNLCLKPLTHNMKRLVFIVALFLSLHAYSQTKFNGDFETLDTGKPKGWILSFDSAQARAYRVTLDSNDRQSGKYSLSIENINNGADYGATVYAIRELYEGKNITLTGYIKTENVHSGYAGIWLRLDDINGNMISIDNMGGEGIRGSQPWKKYTITMPYDPDKANKINVGGLLEGDGKAWFDSLAILIDDKPIGLAHLHTKVLKAADTDTSFRSSSKIDNIQLNHQQLINLTIAGQFWGFLKYYHPAIAKGLYNWDAELFKFLPAVIAADDNKQLSAALEQYLDKLPKPDNCKSCAGVEKGKYAIKPDYGNLLNGSVLSTSITERLNYIRENRNTGPNYYVSMAQADNPAFDNEKSYDNMRYPDAGYRILSLYRYWAIINYFYPYRDIIGEDWNQVLSSELPDFAGAKDEMEYALAVLKLTARLKDTHAMLWGGSMLNIFKGKNGAPFRASFVEGKLVVTELYIDTLDIKAKLSVGDIIYKINGVTVDELVKKYLPYTSASNYDTQLRNLPDNFLLRSNDERMKLTIQRPGGEFDYSVPMGAFKDAKVKEIKGFEVLKNNIGYVFPGRYKNDSLAAIKKAFSSVDGMIIDLRCYPSEFMPFTFGEYIKPKKSAFAKFSAGQIAYPGAFQFMKYYPENGGGGVFKGKIVVIVNATTQSQAEYTTMAFQSSPNVTVIGSTTAGADGNVSYISFPGGLKTMMSGIGIFYPDGGQTQRVGVRIDYKVYPTIKGVAEGRDELMEKAMELLGK